MGDATASAQTPRARPLNYIEPGAEQLPRRWWLPAGLLVIAAMVWNSHGLTPTFYPDPFDLSVLAAMFVSSFFIGYFCTLPNWVRAAFGAVTVCVFLLANLNDNNFRANIYLGDVLLPWSIYVLGGGVLSSVLAALGSRANQLKARRP